MPETLTVPVVARVRRRRLAIVAVRCAFVTRHILGRRAAVAIANQCIRLAAFEYRIGNGAWRPLPTDLAFAAEGKS